MAIGALGDLKFSTIQVRKELVSTTAELDLLAVESLNLHIENQTSPPFEIFFYCRRHVYPDWTSENQEDRADTS
jgi:hypothetical protein